MFWFVVWQISAVAATIEHGDVTISARGSEGGLFVNSTIHMGYDQARPRRILLRAMKSNSLEISAVNVLGENNNCIRAVTLHMPVATVSDDKTQVGFSPMVYDPTRINLSCFWQLVDKHITITITATIAPITLFELSRWEVDVEFANQPTHVILQTDEFSTTALGISHFAGFRARTKTHPPTGEAIVIGCDMDSVGRIRGALRLAYGSTLYPPRFDVRLYMGRNKYMSQTIIQSDLFGRGGHGPLNYGRYACSEPHLRPADPIPSAEEEVENYNGRVCFAERLPPLQESYVYQRSICFDYVYWRGRETFTTDLRYIGVASHQGDLLPIDSISSFTIDVESTLIIGAPDIPTTMTLGKKTGNTEIHVLISPFAWARMQASIIEAFITWQTMTRRTATYSSSIGEHGGVRFYCENPNKPNTEETMIYIFSNPSCDPDGRCANFGFTPISLPPGQTTYEFESEEQNAEYGGCVSISYYCFYNKRSQQDPYKQLREIILVTPDDYITDNVWLSEERYQIRNDQCPGYLANLAPTETAYYTGEYRAHFLRVVQRLEVDYPGLVRMVEVSTMKRIVDGFEERRESPCPCRMTPNMCSDDMFFQVLLEESGIARWQDTMNWIESASEMYCELLGVRSPVVDPLLFMAEYTCRDVPNLEQELAKHGHLLPRPRLARLQLNDHSSRITCSAIPRVCLQNSAAEIIFKTTDEVTGISDRYYLVGLQPDVARNVTPVRDSPDTTSPLPPLDMYYREYGQWAALEVIVDDQYVGHFGNLTCSYGYGLSHIEAPSIPFNDTQQSETDQCLLRFYELDLYMTGDDAVTCVVNYPGRCNRYDDIGVIIRDDIQVRHKIICDSESNSQIDGRYGVTYDDHDHLIRQSYLDEGYFGGWCRKDVGSGSVVLTVAQDNIHSYWSENTTFTCQITKDDDVMEVSTSIQQIRNESGCLPEPLYFRPISHVRTSENIVHLSCERPRSLNHSNTCGEQQQPFKAWFIMTERFGSPVRIPLDLIMDVDQRCTISIEEEQRLFKSGSLNHTSNGCSMGSDIHFHIQDKLFTDLADSIATLRFQCTLGDIFHPDAFTISMTDTVNEIVEKYTKGHLLELSYRRDSIVPTVTTSTTPDAEEEEESTNKVPFIITGVVLGLIALMIAAGVGIYHWRRKYIKI
jgi:hypothetical protein